MENLMLDSCVVFEFKFWDNYFKKFGFEKFNTFANLKLDELIALKEKITNSFPEDFLRTYKSYAFDEKVKQYKFYYSDCKDNVRKYEILSSEKNVSVSPEKKLLYKAKLDEYKSLMDSFVPYEEINADFCNYHDIKNFVEAGQLYKGMIEGKYKCFVNFVSFAELLNHTEGVGRARNKFFTQNELLSIVSKMTLITTNSKDALYYIEKLARAYRNSSNVKDATPMSKDINSLGDWGDSKIMAVSNLAGINLVTNNGKDFIFDKRIKKKNDNIRTHIAHRNQKFSDFATDARPYSVGEILEDKYEEVTKKSKKLHLEKATKSKNLMFGDTLELV